MAQIVQHEVTCSNIGRINVFVKGIRSPSEVVILAVHDLGCDHSMYIEFLDLPCMKRIAERTVWLMIDVPGQTLGSPDLPSDYIFPTMQQIGEDLIHVLDQLKIKEVVCLGEGAGANIVARFAMAHITRVLGVILMHTTGTSATFFEAIEDKFAKWNASNIGSSAEGYLVLHRYGSLSKSGSDVVKQALEQYQTLLKDKTNTRNLKKFVEAFIKRTNIADNIGKLTCQVLFMTGQKSLFRKTTLSLQQALLKQCADKTKVEFIEGIGVANLLEEKPEKVAESVQYFLQGLGLVSSIPMHNVTRPPRLRSMSMEEYDMPKMRGRSASGGSGSMSPVSSSPPEPIPEQAQAAFPLTDE